MNGQHSECSRSGTTMSVREMGQLLGLKKTDSYWLVHRGKFETVQVNGRTRVVIESFENWYAWQIKYHKVDGSPPGEKLRAVSYSVQEVGELLGVNDDSIYELIKRGKLKTTLTDGWMRISRQEFERWYASQSHYRTKEDRAQELAASPESISMPEMARILGVHRNTVYTILQNNMDVFRFVVIGDQKRITRESFEFWYAGQNHYIKLSDRPEEEQQQIKEKLQQSRKKKIPVFYVDPKKPTCSVQEAAILLGVSREDVYAMIRYGDLEGRKYGRMIRIRKEEIYWWLNEQRRLEESPEVN